MEPTLHPLTLQLEALGQLFGKIVPLALARAEIAGPHLSILALSDEAPRTMSELTAKLDVPKSTVTFHVDALEARGLVTRQADPGDRRVTRVAPTDEGRAAILRFRLQLDAAFAKMAEGVSESELTIMESGLKLLNLRGPALLEALGAEGG